MNEEKNTMDQTQYLTFHLAGEEYAVGILQVKEIIAYGILTTVPQTPPSIRGVINLRGSVVPVVDLALKFGLSASAVTNRTCIVIVEVNLDGEPTVMGIVADSVGKRHFAGALFWHSSENEFLTGYGQGGGQVRADP